MENYAILYNPHAGNGRGEENAMTIHNYLTEGELSFRDMTQVESYADFFAGLDENTRVVICGGDGTLNRFLNDTARLTIRQELFYFASGSGNDFLRDVARGNSKVLPLKEYIARLPQVRVNGNTHRFLNGIGYGIDGYCCQVGDELREKSTKPVNYTAIAIKGLLFHYKPTNAVVTVDGVAHRYQKVWLAPTMNGRYYGGGMMPTPAQDRLNPDGTVSAMVMYGSGKLKTLAVFPSIFKGEHVRHKEMVEVLTGRNITVEFDRPTPLQIDGETILDVTRYEVTGALREARAEETQAAAV